MVKELSLEVIIYFFSWWITGGDILHPIAAPLAVHLAATKQLEISATNSCFFRNALGIWPIHIAFYLIVLVKQHNVTYLARKADFHGTSCRNVDYEKFLTALDPTIVPCCSLVHPTKLGRSKWLEVDIKNSALNKVDLQPKRSSMNLYNLWIWFTEF
jgi:hypothetical protein